MREMRVRSDILPLETPVEDLRGKYQAVIISGGPGSVYAPNAPFVEADLFSLGALLERIATIAVNTGRWVADALG